jgi:hypothetical protein
MAVATFNVRVIDFQTVAPLRLNKVDVDIVEQLLSVVREVTFYGETVARN